MCVQFMSQVDDLVLQALDVNVSDEQRPTPVFAATPDPPCPLPTPARAAAASPAPATRRPGRSWRRHRGDPGSGQFGPGIP